MLSRLALSLVHFYRRHLSARKGYRCAWGVHTRISTCSTRGVRIFRRAPFFKALALLRRQFDRCALSAQALRERAACQAPVHEGRYLGSMRMASQRGMVDCDCGGAPDLGCDDCFRGCELPDFQGCNPCGDFEAPHCAGAGSSRACGAATDAFWCCDPGPAGGTACELDCARALRCEGCVPDCAGRSGASANTAAERARQREDERARRREARRQARAGGPTEDGAGNKGEGEDEREGEDLGGRL